MHGGAVASAHRRAPRCVFFSCITVGYYEKLLIYEGIYDIIVIENEVVTICSDRGKREVLSFMGHWNRYKVTGVWKGAKFGFGCYAVDCSTSEKYAITGSSGVVFKGDILQGLFTSRGDFHGTPMLEMTKRLPNMGKDDTKSAFCSMGFKDDEVDSLYNQYGTSTVFEVHRRPSIIKRHVDASRYGELYKALRNSCMDNDVKVKYDFLPSALCERLVQTYGSRALSVLEENPYAMVWHEYVDMRFGDAERVSMMQGMEYNDSRRVEALLKQAFRSIINGCGDAFLEVSDGMEFYCWMQDAIELSGRWIPAWRLDYATLADASLKFASSDGMTLITRNGKTCLYCSESYLAEVHLASNLMNLLKKAPLFDGSGKDVLKYIEDYCVQTGTVSASGDVGLDDKQIMAIVSALRNRASIITGGPGRGKTAIAACICYCWRQRMKGRIILTSYTGKAVSRLHQSVSGYLPFEVEARTMASVNADPCMTPDALRGALVIVDEVSMVDVPTMSRFLSQFSDAQFVFVGDADQLPSIGMGQLLKDMLDSGVIPSEHLVTNYRARGVAGYTLACNSDVIAEKRFADIVYDEYFKWVSQDERPSDAFDKMVDSYMGLIANGYAPDEICMLSPFKSEKDPFSVVTLNLTIRDKVNPNGKPVSLNYAKEPLHIGDRVLMTQNMRDKGIVNGDTGYLIDYDTHSRKYTEVLDDDTHVELTGEEASHLELGYALTVHKSQGSEYKHILFAISSRTLADWAMRFVTRNLIYTAVTRSRSGVYLFGSRQAFEQALRNSNPVRKTLLAEWLREYA